MAERMVLTIPFRATLTADQVDRLAAYMAEDNNWRIITGPDLIEDLPGLNEQQRIRRYEVMVSRG